MEALEAEFNQVAQKEDREEDNPCHGERESGLAAENQALLTEENPTKDGKELHIPKKIHKNLGRKARIKEIEKLIQKNHEARIQIEKKLQERKGDLHRLARYLDYNYLWRWERLKRQIQSCKKNLDTLQQCLQEFLKKTIQGRAIEKSSPLRFYGVSEYKHLENLLHELHHLKNPSQRRDTMYLMQSFYYQMQHGSNSMAEEKNLIREMKENEERREFAATYATKKLQMPQSLASKKDIRARIELLSNELNQLRKKDQAYNAKMKNLIREFEAAESDIKHLQKELADLNQQKDEAHECINQQRKRHGNKKEYNKRYLSLIDNANKAPEKENARTLRQLSNREVEEFKSLSRHKQGIRW